MQAQRIFEEGQKFHQKGKKYDALQRYERALKIDPNFSAARIFKAVILLETGKPLEAIEEAEKAITSMKKPDLAVLVNYGVILKNLGRLDEAANAYEQVLEINPKILSAKSNLATIYMVQGRLDEAEHQFKELGLVMEDAAPWLNLARIALIKNKIDEAEDYITRAEDFDMTHPDCALIRGKLALLEANFKKAYECAMKSLRASPAHRDSWLLLQQIDSDCYDFVEVNDRLEQLSKMKVQSATVLSIAVDISRKHWLWGALPKLEEMLSMALLNNLDKIPTTADIFTLLGANVPQRAHLAAATRCWEAMAQQAPRVPHSTVEPLRNRKLRVGFLSSDLRGHAIGFLVVGLFESLPKERIEWWAYSNTTSDSSTVRERLRDNFDRFINISKLDDTELAKRIKQDHIDILIDLNQMTAETRAPVFAYRPAPVQVQWLGMPGTLGAGSDVDYIIVDPWVVDHENADGFSECLLALPRSYQPNDHVQPNLKLSKSRKDEGLPEHGFIFGVFNQFYKFSPDTLRLWGEILKKTPNSFIWLLEPKSTQLKSRIVDEFKLHGIQDDRILFGVHKPQDEHLARLQWMDLVLDTWPYNAHTTCSDALRAGVPVLTLPGRTFASRVAAGILHTSGLNGWVALSPDDYVKKAIEFGCKSPQEVNHIKEKTRDAYWASPMVDNLKLGKLFESVVFGLYDRAAHGEPPTSLKVTWEGKLEPLHVGRQASFDSSMVFAGAKIDAPETVQALTANHEPKNDLDTGISDSGKIDWLKDVSRVGTKARFQNMQLLQKYILGIETPPLLTRVLSDHQEIDWKPSLPEFGLVHELVVARDVNAIKGYKSSVNSTLLERAVLDGKPHPYYFCNAEGMSAFLRPNQGWLSLFPGFVKWGAVERVAEMETCRLDDIEVLSKSRFIDLDVNGVDLSILKNASEALKEVSMIQIDCAFVSLYEGGSSFFELGSWLESQGFILHKILDEDKRTLKPYASEDMPFAGSKHQVFQAKVVFMPNPAAWTHMSSERLKSVAFFAHAMYRSYDVATKALDVLDSRDNGSRVADYKAYLDVAGLVA